MIVSVPGSAPGTTFPWRVNEPTSNGTLFDVRMSGPS